MNKNEEDGRSTAYRYFIRRERKRLFIGFLNAVVLTAAGVASIILMVHIAHILLTALY